MRKDLTGMIEIDQGQVNGWRLTYNPDDERYYVQAGQVVVATFKELRNAKQYAKTRELPATTQV